MKSFSRGDPLKLEAGPYNDAMEAGADYVRRKRNVDSAASQGSEHNGAVILVQNNSGGTRGRFDVLGIDSPIILPSQNESEYTRRVMFSASLPGPSHVGRFAILRESLPVGGIGEAYLAGVAWARVSVTSDTENSVIAGPRLKTPEYLEAGVSGARILWREHGVGIKNAIVRLFEVGAGFGRIFYNDSGETMPACGLGRITGYSVNSTAGGTVYTIAKPSATFSRYYLVNAASPVKYGQFGVGFLLEDCYVGYVGAEPTVGESFGAVSGSWLLGRRQYGFTYLGGYDSSLGVIRCQQHAVNRVLGKAYSSISANATGTLKVFAGVLGSETDTGQTIEAWNRGGALGTSAYVRADWIGGGWEITAGIDVSATATASVNVLTGATTAFAISSFANTSPGGGTITGVTTATNPMQYRFLSGDSLLLSYSSASSVWQVTGVRRRADICATAISAATISGSPGSFAITDFTNGSGMDVMSSGVTSAVNPLGLSFANGAVLILLYNGVSWMVVNHSP